MSFQPHGRPLPLPRRPPRFSGWRGRSLVQQRRADHKTTWPVWPAGATLRILLVEDSSEATVTTWEIRRAAIPCIVRLADSAASLGMALHEFWPDVILSSHAPPRWDLVESLRTVQLVSPNIPFIALVGTTDYEAVASWLEAGAADCIHKHRLLELGPALLGALGLRHTRDERIRAEALRREGHAHRRLRGSDRCREALLTPLPALSVDGHA